MKCSKCNKEVNTGWERQEIAPPTFTPHMLYFCSKKCENDWDNSECGKNYDTRRLKALEEWLKKCKDGFKWSGGDAKDGWWEKRPSDEVYNFEEGESFLIEETKKIRQKWNIKDNPQEREREQNYPTEIWNSAIRTNC